MASIPVLQKKRGRPATGVDPLLNFRADEALREAINLAMAETGQGSRSEYIRTVLTDHLRAKGYLTAQETTSSLAEQIGDLEQEIADMPADAPPSPQAAMNTMRQALANDDLTQLKNRRTAARRRDRQE